MAHYVRTDILWNLDSIHHLFRVPPWVVAPAAIVWYQQLSEGYPELMDWSGDCRTWSWMVNAMTHDTYKVIRRMSLREFLNKILR
jgi:hypothetical protein